MKLPETKRLGGELDTVGFPPQNIESTAFADSISFFLYILPDPLFSIIGRCTLYTLYGCNQVKELFTSLLRPHIHYSLSVWDQVITNIIFQLTRSVHSTPADNTRKRVWQYIEKESKERIKKLSFIHIHFNKRSNEIDVLRKDIFHFLRNSTK